MMLSAESLYLTPSQYEILLKVLDGFESGRVKDLPRDTTHVRGDLTNKHLDFFTYSTTGLRYACGSAGCILGWARALDPEHEIDENGDVVGHGSFWRNEGHPIQLETLFFTNHSSIGSVADAAKALRQYLETGNGLYRPKSEAFLNALS